MVTESAVGAIDPEPGPLSMRLIGVVGVGGAIGSVARYGVAQWFPATTGFPWSTFTVNVIGAFVLGVLLELLTRSGPDDGNRRALRLLVGTGFCGGLTTYSTLAIESDLLIRAHRSGLATAYAIASVVAGILVVGIGIAVAGRARQAKS